MPRKPLISVHLPFSYVECRGAGKDRTGVVSAIILKKLGYSDQVIVDDYMETKDTLMGFLTSYVKEHPEVDIVLLQINYLDWDNPDI